MGTKRTEANRANSKRSTGPRTPAGKQRAARNSTRHALWAINPVIPGETEYAWRKYRSQIVDRLKPIGPLEEDLAERLAFMLWRLKRVARFETESIRSIHDQAHGVYEEGIQREGERPEDYIERLMKIGRLLAGNSLAELKGKITKANETLSALNQFLGSDPKDSLPSEVADQVLYAAWHVVGSENSDIPCCPDSSPIRASGVLKMLEQLLAESREDLKENPDLLATLPESVHGMIEVAKDEASNDRQEASAELELRTRVFRKQTILMPSPEEQERIYRAEVHLWRMFERVLHELQRLQFLRRGKINKPPAVIDIDFLGDDRRKPDPN